MNWSDYVIKRVAFTIVTIFVAITLNFLLFRVLPGTAVTNLARVPNASVALKQHLRAEFGLNLPLRDAVLGLPQAARARQPRASPSPTSSPSSSNLKSALINTLPGRDDRHRAVAASSASRPASSRPGGAARSPTS